MKLGDYIEAKCLTHNDFAEKIGVSRSTVTKYVLGSRVPNKRVMKKIMEVTGCRVRPMDFYGDGE